MAAQRVEADMLFVSAKGGGGHAIWQCKGWRRTCYLAAQRVEAKITVDSNYMYSATTHINDSGNVIAINQLNV